MGEIFSTLFEYNRIEDVDPDIYEISDTILFLKSMKKFKGRDKTQLCCIFADSSAFFLRMLNQEWIASIGKLENLNKFIDQKLGVSSTAGKFCKIRLQYSLDSDLYFAQQIKELGLFYRRNEIALSRIIISRFEYDLNSIQRKFNNMKYGGERTLVEWIRYKGGSSKSSFFLCQMLENCGRYAEYQELHGYNSVKKSKISKLF